MPAAYLTHLPQSSALVGQPSEGSVLGLESKPGLSVGTYVGASGPAGGVKLRLRVPVAYAGKLKAVSVGGKAWSAFDAKSETVSARERL